MNKFRIGHLIAVTEIGGAQRIVRQLCSETNRLRFDPLVIPFIRQWEPENIFIDELRKENVGTIPIGMMNDKITHLNVPRNLFQVYIVLRKCKIDILHTHGYRSDIIGSLAAKMARIPTVSTCHGWINNTASLRLYNRLGQVFLGQCDRIIVVAREIQQKLEDMGFDHKKIVVIPNAITPEDYKQLADMKSKNRANCGFGLDSPIIGSVGRLSLEKGFDFLMRACVQVIKNIPSAKIILVGDGPAKPNLEKLSYELGLHKNVLFTNFQTEIKDWLSVMDMFVLSSKTEGTPLALLEAMAAGLPVIATKVGEIPNILTDHQNGILIDYGDVKGLSDSILYLLNNPVKARALAEAGKQLVEEKYNVDKWIQQIENIYLALLSERSKSTPIVNT